MGALGEESKRAQRPACWLCCGVCSLVAGLLLLVLGALGAALNQRFTPVYRDIQCEVQVPVIKRVWWDGPGLLEHLHLQMVTVTTCKNPNPYEVKLTSTKSGGIYMGENRNPVGNITSIPAATLAAGSTGKIEADLLISPTAEVIGSGMAMIFGQQTPLYLENKLEVNVDVEIFTAHVKVQRSINKDCGMNLAFHLPADFTTGPMSCADSWGELVLHDAEASEAGPNVLDFSAEDMGGDDIEEAEDLKTTCLGLMMGVGFGLGLLLLIVGGLCLVRHHRLRRRQAREAPAAAKQPAVASAPLAAAPQEASEKVEV